MKKLKPGETITKEGYLYTSEEHEKNLRRIEVINELKALFGSK